MPAEIIRVDFPALLAFRGIRPSCTSFGDADVVDMHGHPLADVPCDVTPELTRNVTVINGWTDGGEDG